MFELISSHIHVILGAFTGWIISKGVRSEEPQLIIYGILLFMVGIAIIFSK